MNRKMDFTISFLILVFGLIYCVLTFLWNQYGLERAYFPGIALMYIICGAVNLLRHKHDQTALTLNAVATNAVTLLYSVYIAYLANITALVLPPFIATTCVLFASVFSIIQLRSSQKFSAKS